MDTSYLLLILGVPGVIVFFSIARAGGLRLGAAARFAAAMSAPLICAWAYLVAATRLDVQRWGFVVLLAVGAIFGSVGIYFRRRAGSLLRKTTEASPKDSRPDTHRDLGQS